ncbi:NACHT domain-containing protein [Actinoplanes sp. NPDC051861]|uniref:NACHT and WD40 repeat domain-containing protein n=1 Tax=Actinoplanes sp. NPDC051861 TaxID=3155170 RepID=UPI003417C2C9
MKRRSLRVWAMVAFLICTVASGAWVLFEVLRGEVDWGEVAALVVAASALAFQVVSVFQDAAANQPSFDDQVEELASAVGREWYDEAEARRLRGPQVLSLSWEETARPVGGPPRPAEIGEEGLKQRPALRGRLEGDFDAVVDDLAARFRRLDDSSIVVLGQPGAGKSVLALLLTLALIRSRDPGDPVPVLVPASSWDPLSEEFVPWLTRTLAEAYYNGDETITSQLLNRHVERVQQRKPQILMPIIDGLDEIAESGRRQAATYLNRAVRDGWQVVVTCRAVEYQEMITGGAPKLTAVPVVEVRPVTPADVRAYLGKLPWPDGTSWSRVLDEMDKRPEGPVAAALSTPLMVSFARLVYQRLGGDPSELLGANGALPRFEVEDRLTSRVVEAAYTAEPLVGEADAEGRRWPRADARRWLTFIAHYLHRTGQRDVVWWRLSAHLLPAWFGPMIGLVIGAPFMVAVAVVAAGSGTLVSGLTVGAITGSVVALSVMVLWFVSADRPPGRLSFALAGSWGRLRRGFLLGFSIAAVFAAVALALIAVVVQSAESWALWVAVDYVSAASAALACAVVLGLALAAHEWVNAPPAKAAQTSLDESIRHDRVSALVGGLLVGLIVAVTTAPAIVLGAAAGDLLFGLYTGWSGWPGSPEFADLGASRMNMIAGWAAGSPVIVAVASALIGLGVGTLILLSRAWPRYEIARLWARTRRRLPWRVAAFLSDARRREVLRRVSGGYQFRHIRLHDQLVSPAATVPADTGNPAVTRSFLSSHPRAPWVAGAAAMVLVAAVPIVVLPDDDAAIVLRAAGTRRITIMSIDPDERWIAGVGGDNLRVWDLDKRELVLDDRFPVQLDKQGTSFEYVVQNQPPFDPSGRFYALTGNPRGDTSGKNVAWIWDLETGTRVVDGHVGGAKFIGAGRVLLHHYDSSSVVEGPQPLELWNLTERRRLWRIDDTQTMPIAVSNELFVGEVEGRLSAWQAKTGAEIPPDPPITGTLEDVKISPGGALVGVGVGSAVRVWEPASGRTLATAAPVEGTNWTFGRAGTRVIASSGGRSSTSLDDNKIRIWEARTGRLEQAIPAPPDLISGTGLAARSGPTETRESVSVQSFGDYIAALSESGSAGPENRLHIWDVRNGKNVVDVPVSGVQISASGSWLVYSSGTTAVVRNIAGMRDRPTESYLSSAFFNPDESLMLVYEGDAGMAIWNVANAERSAYVRTNSQQVFENLSWLTGGGLLAADDVSVSYYDREGKRRFVVEHGFADEPGYDLRFAASDDLIAVPGAIEKIELHNAGNGHLRRTLSGHVGVVQELQFIDEGRSLVTRGFDGTIRIWDIER